GSGGPQPRPARGLVHRRDRGRSTSHRPDQEPAGRHARGREAGREECRDGRWPGRGGPCPGATTRADRVRATPGGPAGKETTAEAEVLIDGRRTARTRHQPAERVAKAARDDPE